MAHSISEWQRELACWQKFSAHIRLHVENTEALIGRDLRETARRAGLDPQIATLHAHNSICSFNSGHPWREVDYSLARRVLFLEQRMFQVSRLGNRIVERAYRRMARRFNMACAEVQS